MLRQYSSLLRNLLIFGDFFISLLAFLSAYLICQQTHDHLYALPQYLWVAPVLAAAWSINLYGMGMYKSLRFKNFWQVLFPIVSSGCLVFLGFTCAVFLFKISYFSRILIALAFAMTMLLLAVEKLGVILLLSYVRKQGFNFRHVLIVGTGGRAHSFIRNVKRHQEFGMKIIGVVDADPEKIGRKVCGCSIIGTLDDIKDILWNYPIDNVFFILPRSILNRIEEQLLCCETLGITFSIATDLFDTKFTMGRPDAVLDMPLVTFESVPQKHYQLLAKRFLDIVLSSLALLVLAPIFAAVAAAIKMTSKGPVFFSQVRCSVNGRMFHLHKFRTMVPDAQARLKELMAKNEMEGPAFKMDNDPRVTSVGRILRKFSLDELPQFWNVLMGDMSLVGPRPPLPQEVEKYGLWHRRRLSMRPGITCLWQISGRNRITNFDDWAKLDLQYIDKWSLGLDFNILLRTVPAVLMASGAK